ncbi:hypothetical protein HRR80_008897 [Exophiala dermatitidis]|uniref:Uncharacterized protein n=1 Tax=Exophiala dermatitidis TaxID=5970 RepID=A0AAN6IQP6_EXODE|nr:hypothetical protein HRR77_009533 [Exophiala dermatitidis]KAJ8986955.1 hypothetical protein HRR80_008897 [Exophiala dermatitidis]
MATRSALLSVFQSSLEQHLRRVEFRANVSGHTIIPVSDTLPEQVDLGGAQKELKPLSGDLAIKSKHSAAAYLAASTGSSASRSMVQCPTVTRFKLWVLASEAGCTRGTLHPIQDQRSRIDSGTPSLALATSGTIIKLMFCAPLK